MYFTDTRDKADSHTYGTTVIPYRGAWLEYETDLSDIFYVRITTKGTASCPSPA